MVNTGYSAEEGAQVVSSKVADSVAFGTAFLANPDLPVRIKAGAELNAPNPDILYTDYPLMGA